MSAGFSSILIVHHSISFSTRVFSPVLITARILASLSPAVSPEKSAADPERPIKPAPAVVHKKGNRLHSVLPVIACILTAWGLVLLCGRTAQAAEVPGPVQPGQIEQQFKPEPEFRAKQPAPLVVPEPGQPVPVNAKGIRFELTKLMIEGSTVYPEHKLLSPHRQHLGKEVSLSDIYQIAAELTAKYRNDGYILSQVVVPAQSIEQGVVHLRAIEGYIARVTVEGVEGDRRKLVDRYAEEIRNCRPLRNRVLERYLLLMNDLPGAFASATIQPSQNEPGASELTIQFTQQKIQGGLSVDNRGGESLGPIRISGDAVINSLLGLQENTTLRVVSSGDKKLTFASLAHEERIGLDGGRLSLMFSAVEAEPKEMLFIPLNLETSSRTAALSYSYPLIRSRSQNLFLRAGLTAHDGETKIFDVEDTRDRIRAARLGATYDRSDSWNGISLLDVELSQGINALGSSGNGDPMLSRYNGRVDFTKTTLYAARLQSLSSHWSILAAVNAQYAWTDLLSSELYSFGGEHFGRGYDPSELVGDHGIAGKVELRYTNALPVGFAFTYSGYAFYDAGIVFQRSPGELDRSESAASAGMGLRMYLGKHVTCFAELAKPLTRDVTAEGNRNARVYAGGSIRF
jgi:hemolysin activation/secretion protein